MQQQRLSTPSSRLASSGGGGVVMPAVALRPVAASSGSRWRAAGSRLVSSDRCRRCRAAAGAAADAAAGEAAAAAADAAAAAAAPPPPQRTKCYLVGVGPGGLQHTTLRACDLVKQADVLVVDDLGTSSELLALAPPGCQLHNVGKRGGRPSMRQPEIDALLVALCGAGGGSDDSSRQEAEGEGGGSGSDGDGGARERRRAARVVVRLKGGCPSTFSRVSSEAAALAAAGVPFELVPGLSTATAAPVLAAVPLTDLSLGATCYAVTSAHDVDAVDWPALARIPTLVLLMGGARLPAIASALLGSGWAGDTPVAVMRAAGTPEQRAWYSTIDTVATDTAAAAGGAEGGPSSLSPCVIVVGRVAGLPAAWARKLEEATAGGGESGRGA